MYQLFEKQLQLAAESVVMAEFYCKHIPLLQLLLHIGRFSLGPVGTAI